MLFSSVIGLWNSTKRKKTNNGRLGPRRRNDGIPPNKKAHSGLSESFKELGGVFVPG